MAIKLSDIKSEIQKSGASKGKIMFFKEGTKARVRFLSDFEDAIEIPFHDSFKLSISVPCQELFGRECEYCENEELRTRNMYAWSVYDYDSKEVKLLFAAVSRCSPIPSMVALYESYGTLLDRDFEIKRMGSGTETSYSFIPLEKMKFRNTKAKAMSEQAVLKCIDKAYPANNSELGEEEEEEEKERPRKRNTGKGSGKSMKGKMNEPEPEEEEEEETEDWDEEETKDYESMSARELYGLCEDKGIECKPRKTKQYYIDLLEQQDEEDAEDDW